MRLSFPVSARLTDDSPILLVPADERDVEPLRRLYRIIVDEGTYFPHDRFPDQDDFLDYWFRGKSTVAAHVTGSRPSYGYGWGILSQAELAWAGETSGERRFHRRTRLAQQGLGPAAGHHDAGLRQATRLPQRDLQPSPHYSQKLLLQPPIRRYDKPDGGRARRSVGQHTVSSMLPSFAAPRARLAWHPGGFVTNSLE